MIYNGFFVDFIDLSQ